MKRYVKASQFDIGDMRNYLSEQDGVDYEYKLEDTYGFPQAGVDVKYFETWTDLEEYLEENPDVEERIAEGYAGIFDV